MSGYAAIMPPSPICCYPSLPDATARCQMGTACLHVAHAGLGDETSWQRAAGEAARMHAALPGNDYVGNAKPADGDAFPSLRTGWTSWR